MHNLLQPIQSPENLLHELMWCGRISWDGTSSKLSEAPISAFESGFSSSSQILGKQIDVKQLAASRRCLIGISRNGKMFKVPYDNNLDVSSWKIALTFCNRSQFKTFLTSFRFGISRYFKNSFCVQSKKDTSFKNVIIIAINLKLKKSVPI